MKTCTKCGETKSAEDFYKRAKSNDGLMSWCKECSKAHDQTRNTAPERKAMRANSKRARYAPVKAANQAEHASVKADLLSAASKVCKKCGQEKPVESYTVDTRYKDGRYPWCFECRKEWRGGRKDKQKELHANWRETNREHVRKHGREYYQNNEEQRKHNRDTGRIRDRERYRNNPEVKERKDRQAAEKNRRRRALLYGIDTAHHTEQEWLELCARYDHRCLCCGERKPLSRDHVVPVTSGGLDTIENIQPLCKVCNSRKNDKTIDYRKDGD